MDKFLLILSICSAIGLPTMFGIGCFVVKSINGHLASQKTESNALKYGMQAMLRDVLLKRYRELRDKGVATYNEKENYEELYKQYKALGGNSFVEKLYEEIVNMPIDI